MSWSATFFFDIALSVEWGWVTSCLRREALYHVNQQILSKASWLFQRTLRLMQVSIGQTPLIPGKLLLFCRVSVYTCFSPWFPGTNNKRRLGRPLQLDDLRPTHSTYHQQLPHAMGRQKTGRAIEFTSPLYDEGQSITYAAK